MKKTLIAFSALLTLNNIAYAGGDIAPVDAPVISEVENPSAFYLGLGFGQTALNNTDTSEEIKSIMITLQAGYQYNAYLALEGRASFGFNTDYTVGTTGNLPSDYDGELSSWGLYVKPMYPVTDTFDVYALLGYGGLNASNLVGGDAYESNFQWGIGAQYAITDNVLLFADYVKLYDDTGFDYRAKSQNVDADAWTLGITYTF